METPKRKKNEQNDKNSSSDDSSVRRHISGDRARQTEESGGAYYGSHVASVCNEINAEAERAMSPFERLMLQKRRETNRLSARRCRKRRREEIKVLQARQQMLQSETEQLEAEKARLQEVFQQEIAAASSRNSFGHNLNIQAQPAIVSQADPMMLQWWMQQRRRMGFFPGNVASAADPSIASLATSLGHLSGNQHSATSAGFASAVQPPSRSPLEMLNLLPLIQAWQDAASGVPSNPNPWLLPQALAASSPLNLELSSLATVTRNNQPGMRDEEQKLCTGDSIDFGELQSNTNESYHQKPRGKNR